jgi:hypothetical protein
MSTVIVLAFSDLARDPRVNRQIRFLADSYDVVAVGYGPPDVPGVRYIPIANTPPSPPPAPPPVIHKPKNFFLRKAKGALRLVHGHINTQWRRIRTHFPSLIFSADKRYWRQGYAQALLHQLGDVRADLIIANDVLTLPIACRWAQAANAKVLYDAHEYAPLEFEELWRWRWFHAPMIRHICRTYIPQVDAMTTVCQGIADAYADLTGVVPTVLTNAPEYNDLPVRPHVPGTKVQLIHHGIAFPSRKLENMIYMMDHLDDRFDLTFVLIGTVWDYRHRLERLAERTGRIRFADPVGMRELPRFLNQFDIGLFLLEPMNFSYLHALPNKLFEFIQGRLAVAIGASPEMAAVVKRAQVGIVGEDYKPKTLAAHLNRLTSDDINRFKANANAAARALSAETNRRILLDMCRRLCPPAQKIRAA